MEELRTAINLDSENRYCYVVVRKDLDHTYRIIQVGHACMEMGRILGAQLRDFEKDPAHFCLLEVADEKELRALSKKLLRSNVDHYIFHEPDYDVGYSALCTEPLQGGDRAVMSGLSMYQDERASVVSAP